MQKTFLIEGMDCADCARHVEEGVQKLPGVQFARVDFATAQLVLEGEVDEASLQQRVQALGYRLKDEQTPIPEKAESFWLGLGRYLLSEGETRLALLGGAFLLISAGLRFFAGMSNLALGLQLVALGLAGYPIARSALANLFINRSISINLLMTLAAIGAVIIGESGEAATLIFLFALAEALEGYSTDRARRTLSGLQNLTPTHALRLDNDGEHWVPVQSLLPGDRVRVRPGERIPADGVVHSGASDVNQAPITGESLPVLKQPGDAVFAGTVNGNGALDIQVTRLAKDSTLARIVQMVTEAQGRRARLQRWIDRFAAVYTPAVVGIAFLVAVIPPLFFHQPFWNTPEGHGWLYRALALLVIACPCALVISAPVTILSGLTAAARQGVLIKGGVYLETLAQVKRVAFDKTGTLTVGKPVLTDHRAVDCPGCEDRSACPACRDVLALAAALERASAHPLAHAVVSASQAQGVHQQYSTAQNLVTLNGGGIQGWIEQNVVTLGSHTLFEKQFPHSAELCAQVETLEQTGETTMLLSQNGEVRGYLAVADEIRPESRQVVDDLHRLGIRTVILTGDHPAAAQRVARQLGVDEIRAGLLPEQKLQAVEELARADGTLAMLGDGINDTPALSAAQVGIAVGGASNAQAMETADVVLLGGDLSKLPYILRLARFVMRIIYQNVAFSLGIKALFLVLAMLGATTLWMAVLADMGVSLLVIFNGLRPLRFPQGTLHPNG